MTKHDAFTYIWSESANLVKASANGVQNRIWKPMDIIQEMMEHLWSRLLLLPEEKLNDPKFNLLGWGRVVLKGKAVDLRRYFMRKCRCEGVEMNWNAIDVYKEAHASPFLEVFEEEDLYEKIIREAYARETKVSGITGFGLFVSQALQPDQKVCEEFYRRHCRTKKVGKRQYRMEVPLPPTMLAGILGIPQGRLVVYRKEFSQIAMMFGLKLHHKEILND